MIFSLAQAKRDKGLPPKAAAGSSRGAPCHEPSPRQPFGFPPSQAHQQHQGRWPCHRASLGVSQLSTAGGPWLRAGAAPPPRRTPPFSLECVLRGDAPQGKQKLPNGTEEASGEEGDAGDHRDPPKVHLLCHCRG